MPFSKVMKIVFYIKLQYAIKIQKYKIKKACLQQQRLNCVAALGPN